MLNDTITYKEFVIKRVATIFPLQWLFTILFVCCSIGIVTYWAVPFHLSLTQSLIPLWEVNFTINTPSWFLSSIFICYLLTPPVLKMTRERYVYVILFVLALICWHSFLYVLPEDIGRRWLCYINPIARLQNYGAGILIALFWPDVENVFKKVLNEDTKTLYTLLEIIVIVLISISLFNLPILGINRYLSTGSIILDCFCCLFIIVFSIGKGAITQVLSLPIFGRLGKTAIAIYMSHGFVLHYAKPIYQESVLFYIIVVYAITIVFSILLESYYCRYTKQALLRVLN